MHKFLVFLTRVLLILILFSINSYKTYGEETVNHIKKMTNHKINRKHHNTEVNY